MTDLERPLPEDHANVFRTALRIDEHEDLPVDIVELYWKYERLCRRVLKRPVDTAQIPLLVLIAGRGIGAPPVTYADSCPKRGDKCLVKWKKDWRWAEFHGFKGKNVLAQVLDENAEVREFEVTDVRQPTKDEKASIGA